MDDRPIGVFDSGLGGLTAVRRLREILPQEDIEFFGDTGRVPYGGRDRETLLRFAKDDLDFLLRRNVKAVVVACGTISSVALDTLQNAGIPVRGVVQPAVRVAAEASRSGRIGITGTAAAINSGAYERALKALRPDCEILTSACPRFVPLIEGGAALDDPELLSAAKEYIEPIRDFGADTLILGCTHYPLIADAIRRVVGEKVRLIDVGAEAAEEMKAVLTASGSLNGQGKPGYLRCHVSGSPGSFAALAGHFLGGSRTLRVSPAKSEAQESYR